MLLLRNPPAMYERACSGMPVHVCSQGCERSLRGAQVIGYLVRRNARAHCCGSLGAAESSTQQVNRRFAEGWVS